MSALSLAELLTLTKDGEWGADEGDASTVPMLVIRGTDFADVRYGDLSSVPIRYIPSAIAARKQLQPGDILIETAGGTRDQPTGRTVLLKANLFVEASNPITCASFSRFLRVNRDLIYPDYFFWFLQYLYLTGDMYPYHVQHTGVARFQYTQFATQTLIPRPSPKKQEAIADLLNALEDKIELNRRINQTLETIARALFQDWFLDFGPIHSKLEGQQAYLASDIWSIFPSTVDSDGTPHGWRMGELCEIVEFNPKEPIAAGTLAPYLDMAALPTSGSISDPPVERAFTSGMRFRNHDTLLARITPCLENGKAAYVQTLQGNALGWGSTEFIVMRPLPPVPKPYSYLLARDPSFRNRAIQSMTGTSGRQRARTDVLMQHPVAIPDSSIWAAFGSMVEPMFGHIRANGEEMQTLVQMRDILLPKLMSGEIGLDDAAVRIQEAL